MAPKRPSPLEDPPAASTSEEEEEDGDEEEEEEDEEDEEDEEGDDDKLSSGKKLVQTPVTRSVPKSASSDDEESGTESGSDSDPPPDKFGHPSRIDPNIKPISSKPMDDGAKSKKPQANPSTPSAPQAKSTVPVKRPIESDKDDNKDSKKKKKKSVDDEDDAGISEDTEKKPGDDKKKQLFQRLWTEDDELAVLKGMLDYYSKKGTDPVMDMNTFHDFIKKSLHFDVSRNQLYDKIRRLKKKYMNNTARAREGEDPHFSKPHEHKSFELSKKIWGSDDAINDHSASNGNLGVSRAAKIAAGSPQSKAIQLSDVPKGAAKSEVSKGSAKSEVPKGAAKSEVSKGAVKDDEEIDWSMFPHLVESFQAPKEASFMSMPRMGDSFVKEGFRLLSSSQLNELEKKWRELRREEIDLFCKRMELMGEQTKLFQEAYNRKK